MPQIIHIYPRFGPKCLSLFPPLGRIWKNISPWPGVVVTTASRPRGPILCGGPAFLLHLMQNFPCFELALRYQTKYVVTIQQHAVP